MPSLAGAYLIVLAVAFVVAFIFFGEFRGLLWLGLLGGLLGLHQKAHTRARGNLQRWVDDQGYSLVSAKTAWFSKGPYTWTSSNGQIVFRITILDKQGQERTGWVRCGHWLASAALSDTIDGVLDEAA